MSPLERLLLKVDPSPGACWMWAGQVNNKGYGLFSLRNHKRGAHVIAWELMVGPVPEGLELDHLCNVPLCVNPAHLEPVTHAENMRRIQDRQQKCRKVGHDWTDPRNVRRHRDGARSCAECARISDRERSPRLRRAA